MKNEEVEVQEYKFALICASSDGITHIELRGNNKSKLLWIIQLLESGLRSPDDVLKDYNRLNENSTA